MKIAGVEWQVDLGALALTLALGAVGGVLAHLAQLPLGYLLGSMVLVGVLAAFDIKPLGRRLTLPTRLRFSFVPVIGIAIGGAFTPEVARAALGWGPSLAALFLFVPVAHVMGYALYRRGGLARAEAYYSAIPGGLIESVQMGEEAGADVRVLITLQTLRLIGTIIAVPLIFLALTGHTVGSAAGTTMVGASVPLTTGLMQAIPPGWLVSVTQVILGTGLGVRFVGMDRKILIKCGKLAAVNGTFALVLAFVFAELVHLFAGEPLAAAFLAFAPGGLAEMSLVALSLNMSVIYVTAHHVLRIVLAVSFAKLGKRFI